jgi:hypothetical protein
MNHPAEIKKVISASRRIEMLGFFPEQLAEILEKRCPPDRVHTVVLWSKNPSNLIHHLKIRDCLKKYDQIYLHFTVTGMGGSFLEPSVPPMDECLELIPAVVDFLGDPRRLRIRFDPIVHLLLPNGGRYSNLRHFDRVARAAKAAGAGEIITSWMAPYPKVVGRLRKHRIAPVMLTESDWKKEADWLSNLTSEIGIRVSGCCVQGFAVGSCINGGLLSRLHPNGEPSSVQKAKGQRPLCGCTESWDIGWYYRCPGGCLYCYANPAEPVRLVGKEPE